MARICSNAQVTLAKCLLRPFSTKANANLKNGTHSDIIGPPDPISNLRPIIFAKPQNETSLEKKYRQARQDTQLWNQNFWTQHNTSFSEERKRFQENLKAQGKEMPTADDMSVFYKKFLDKNWKTHFNYNIAWYKRNVKLLCLEMRVRLAKLKFR